MPTMTGNKKSAANRMPRPNLQHSMTSKTPNKQAILEKALLKANKNGWKPLATIPWHNVQITQWQGNGMVGIALLYEHGDSSVQWLRELEGIIFNHDFARALWGTDDIIQPCIYCKTPMGFQHLNPCPLAALTQSRPLPAVWKYHLQQMVIADDPIKYLADNI